TSTSTDETNPQEEKESLWVLILKALALGFGSVLTPCVFPLIPLTVSFFTKQSDSRAKGIRNATFYGLSIITIYTVLGLLVAAIFGPDAMRQLSVSPGFNLLLFAALFIFGLSFLGWFDITLPASWSTAMSKGSDRGGLIGIFLMAMTLAIVSFSCTGPLVFTALADAASGSEFIRPIAAMLAFSGALALPFVFFAIFPGYMNSLPNSGGWLVSVKVVLGLLEIALAFIYLSRADLVMHLGILDREIFIGAWIVIFAILGIYLLGKLQLPHDSPVDRISVPRLLLAMTAFWFVTYLLPGLWGAPLNMLGGYIPESNNQMGVMLLEGQVVSGGNNGALEAGESDICNYPGKISEHLSEGTPRGFCAFYDLEQGLAYAKEVNKPVFLDFTGHTCANCRYLEKNAWIDNEVRNYINNEFVLISLYTDDRKKLPEVEELPDGRKLRTVGDKWIEYERTVYRQNAQPYYVLMDHDKSNLIEPTGFNPPLDVQEYRDFFKAGLEEFQQRHGL
ncbi:MAG: thioredoxin family protein, partial [Bacteroidetes bacterium]|nr:thioredoxin family protein [Bacteroidota bacterium]